jgi:hypothetical protein
MGVSIEDPQYGMLLHAQRMRKEVTDFCNIIRGDTCNFCCVLFIRSKVLNLAQSQGEGITGRRWGIAYT